MIQYLERNIERPKLYEALTFLEERLTPRDWLVRRYHMPSAATAGMCARNRKKRQRLRVAARGIQLACAEAILAEMKELARNFRQNKSGIAKLRRMLELLRHPVKR